MLRHMSEFPSSVRLKNIPLYVYTTIQSSMDVWILSAFWPPWIMLLWLWWFQYLLSPGFRSSWIYIQKWKCWSIWWFSFNYFRICRIVFHRGSATINAQGFQFLHILTDLVTFCLLSKGHPNGCEGKCRILMDSKKELSPNKICLMRVCPSLGVDKSEASLEKC